MLNRRARAAMAVAAFWGLMWAVWGPLLNTAMYFILYDRMKVLYHIPISWLSVLSSLAVSYATLGGLCGVGFAFLTMSVEGGKDLRQLSMRRLAAWGAIGGAILPAALVLSGIAHMGVPLVLLCPLSGLFGAGLAAVQLGLALRSLPTGSVHETFSGQPNPRLLLTERERDGATR